MHDFIVIGAGIAGASVACELARRASVLLLEAEPQPGYHTTGRSAAFFSETYGNSTVRALSSGSKAFLESAPGSFCEHPLLLPCGALYIGRADQQRSLDGFHESVRESAAEVFRESAAFALELVPVLRSDYVGGCVWEPGAHAIDVHELLQGYLRAARASGLSFIGNARVEGLVATRGAWKVITTAGDYRCATVVNAAGAWADQVADMAGAHRIGLVPKRRTVCIFDPPEGVDISGWPGVVDIDELFYFKPDAGKILLSPADETPMEPADAHAEDLAVAVAVDRLERATHISVERIDRTWAGLRSFVADKTPVVGFDDGLEGFFWLAGQGGYGIQTSPALASCAAALATGERVPEDLRRRGITAETLSPSRCRDLL